MLRKINIGVALLCGMLPFCVPARAQSAHTHWVTIDDAQLKLDSKPPLTWSVFQPDKKTRKKGSDVMLILLGHRYLMLDKKAKIAYLVLPEQLQSQGKDFESDDLAAENRVIPTSDWVIRDVGSAELVRVTLGDYGRLLDVQLPHLPDLSSFY